MVRIRAGQAAEVTLRLFVDRLTTRLRADFAHELAARQMDAQLERFVRIWIDEAAQFGVVNEPDVELFVQCKAIFGPGFGDETESSWAASILRHPHFDGEAKMDQI